MKLNRRIISLLAVFILLVSNVFAQDYKRKWSADKGDGTYVNPILNGDFPDCDVIRVDSTFYFVSTTMFHFPGATLLKSHDLVNWEYCCNPLEKIDSNNAYDLIGGANHYAQGQWAASLNYHNGKFYIYFICYGRSGVDNTQNILLTADKAEGPWTMTKMADHYYDSGWLFDDGANGDGYVYVACGIGDIYVNKLNAKTLTKITSTKIFSKESHEGSHMYHIGDYYYVYLTTGGYWKGQTILRSKDPMGPYEEVPYTLFQGDAVHQGALVDTPTGEWWTILFKDAGAIGRTPFLEPVTWKDGWPQIGVYDATAKRWADVSRNGAKHKKPTITNDTTASVLAAINKKLYLPTNDAFASDTLGMQWEWNHNPQTQAWSLTKRPGWMRLYSCTVCDNLVKARGSLTQRILGYSANGTASSSWVANYGTAKFDLSGMKDGDVAGLSIFQNPYSFIGVKMKDGKKYLYSQRCTFSSQVPVVVDSVIGAEITSDIIYLRAITNFGTKACNYYYSYSATTGYKKFGVSMTMDYTLDVFVGQRYYLFNYSTIATGGYIDIDWFTTEQSIQTDYFAQLDAQEVIAPSEEEEAWNGFPLTKERFDPSILGTGTFAPSTKFLKTAANGLAGWQYPEPWDISQFNYLCVNLLKKCTMDAEIRIYDADNIWAEPYVVSLKNQKSVTIDLHNMVTATGTKLDPSHISIVAFNSDGSAYLYLKSVFLSDDGTNETVIKNVATPTSSRTYYDLTGRKISSPTKGIYISNGKKILIK